MSPDGSRSLPPDRTASGINQRVDQLGKMAETGVDSVIMISNRLAMPDESDETVLAHLKVITAALDPAVGLGIYECPQPYKRLLSDEVVSWCAQSGRLYLHQGYLLPDRDNPSS